MFVCDYEYSALCSSPGCMKIYSFGVLCTSWVSSHFGRKRSLIASGIIYIIGSLIQAIVGLGSSRVVALRLLYFSRFFAGIGVGMVSALAPSYISECMPRHIRGRCTGLVQFSDNIGMMLSCTCAFRQINLSLMELLQFG
jgi:MFS family permease